MTKSPNSPTCQEKDHFPDWRVVTRNANYSTFNGGRRTWSPYSELTCLRCGKRWRTKAGYVVKVRNLERENGR